MDNEYAQRSCDIEAINIRLCCKKHATWAAAIEQGAVIAVPFAATDPDFLFAQKVEDEGA